MVWAQRDFSGYKYWVTEGKGEHFFFKYERSNFTATGYIVYSLVIHHYKAS